MLAIVVDLPTTKAIGDDDGVIRWSKNKGGEGKRRGRRRTQFSKYY